MKRRQKRRDGFQGYSAAAAAAWDRVFAPEAQESPAPETPTAETGLQIPQSRCVAGGQCNCETGYQ